MAQVWIVRHSHKHGTDIGVYSTEQKAGEAYDALVCSMFGEEFPGEDLTDTGEMCDRLAETEQFFEISCIDVDPNPWWAS